jgi:hypothetical protein
MLEDVNDLEIVPAREIGLADALEVVDREGRAWRGSGDVELEQELVGQTSS